MKKDKKQLKEAVKYFKSNSVYQKLFLEFKKKYESLGRVAGSVSLKAFTHEEMAVLAEFMGMRLDQLVEKNKLTLLQFEKQLTLYRFGEINLKDLLESYFNHPLISNSERRENKLHQKNKYFNDLKNKFHSIRDWLAYIESKPADTHWMHRLIDGSFEQFKTYTNHLNKSIDSLPDKPVRLPVFAQQITSNPHAFDRNEVLGRLLIHLLTFKLGEEMLVPSTSEEISELLFSFNILRDDITNYVTVVNLLAETKSDKDKLWQAASDSNSVMNIPIRELFHVQSLYSNNSSKEVWVVENSGVFSSLLDEVPNAPLICTHGQFKLAAWKVFDLLVESDHTLHYASDLDPEGIGMAYRLLNRYPENVKLWNMDKSSYHNSISDNDTISEARLNQLSNFNHPLLTEVSNVMLERKLPGYQEALLDEMIEYLKNKM